MAFAPTVTVLREYTNAQWADVVREVEADEPPVGSATLEDARRKLEQAGTWYLDAVALRRDKNARHKLEMAKSYVDQLSGCHDLKKHIADLLEEVIAYNQRHSRRGDPQRDTLCHVAMMVWAADFKRAAMFSREVIGGKSGPPSGPTVRFLLAALQPILGPKTPKPEGLKNLINSFRNQYCDQHGFLNREK